MPSNDYEMVAILMARDGLSREEVMEQINGFKDELLSGECYDPEEDFMEAFGLEPDYLIDIMF
jgi:hypothetical protein